MRKSLSVLVFLSLLHSATVFGQRAEEQSLRQELENVFNALGEGDGEYFSDHYVKDVSRIHMSGGVDVGWNEQKASGLKGFMDSGWRIKTTNYDLSDIRVFGDFAVTAGTAEAVQIMPGAEKGEAMSFRFSYVWMKRDGRWLEVHHHVSALD